MKKTYPHIIVCGVVLLFFIQSAGTLVESIYMMVLLIKSLNEKALGLLLFFAPLLPLPFFKRNPRLLGWILFGILFLSRGLMPYLETGGRLLASGIAAGASLSLLFLILVAVPRSKMPYPLGVGSAVSLALAVALSALLRSVGLGIEYSLTPAGGWAGWIAGVLLGWMVFQLDLPTELAGHPKGRSVTAPLLGIYLVLTLVYFSISAPAVIVRWTEGSYPLVVIMISLFSVAFAWLLLTRPGWIDRLPGRILLLWNLLFSFSLVGTLLAQHVSFPRTLESPEVVVGAPTNLQQMPLVLMLIFFPVLFLDMCILVRQVQQSAPAPRHLTPGIASGSLALILLIFMHIFTNTWGYVAPVSTSFRNMFWFPYLLLAGSITLLTWVSHKRISLPETGSAGTAHWSWTVVLALIFLFTAFYSLPRTRIQPADAGKTSLVAMTYNVQQFNGDDGEKAFDSQIALIQRASPDILAMQETDSARISLNNNDYVRYFAEKLGYFAFYGPTPVSGTFGTAILSKYPLENTRSVFIYSDQDEVGVAEAEIEVGGQRFFIYNVHPDGSDPAMLVFAQTILDRSQGKTNVIALGDYNLRDYEEAYQLIDSALVNAWTSVYPSEISDDGLDMSGENRIDHIFISADLQAHNPVYILPPESATDHPVHWSEIIWGSP